MNHLNPLDPFIRPCTHVHEEKWDEGVKAVLKAVKTCPFFGLFCFHLQIHGRMEEAFQFFGEIGDDGTLFAQYRTFLDVAGLVDYTRGIREKIKHGIPLDGSLEGIRQYINRVEPGALQEFELKVYREVYVLAILALSEGNKIQSLFDEKWNQLLIIKTRIQLEIQTGIREKMATQS